MLNKISETLNIIATGTFGKIVNLCWETVQLCIFFTKLFSNPGGTCRETQILFAGKQVKPSALQINMLSHCYYLRFQLVTGAQGKIFAVYVNDKFCFVLNNSIYVHISKDCLCLDEIEHYSTDYKEQINIYTYN